ncbi:sialate O-acetylesterase [Pontiellaceae bacterium B1224]|nr:sialate O-acetylesterase [Pontiellaceae bacterium B1224]
MSSISQAEHYKVYLLGGQSNAAGRGDASELSAPYDSPQTDVAFYWHSTLTGTINGNLTTDTWLDLQPDSGEGKNSPSGHAVEFGPELAFGRTMADADPNANIAIIKYAHGGSNLHTQWAEGGDMYQTFLTTVNAALTALTNAGHTYELTGMFWQQGEADTGATNADNYEANLTGLIARVRADLFGGLIRPFVIGGLSSNQYSTISDTTTGAGKVRLAQEMVAQNVMGVGFANADNCEVYEDYNIHFNYLGQLALGTAHATEMLRMEALEALDPDYDGLLEDQEIALGTDPHNPDSDDDGQNDGFEFRAGTNPTNAASLFKVTNIMVVSNAVSLTWPSKSGNLYGVETSSALSEWTEVDVDVPASTEGTSTVWTSATEGVVPAITNVLALYNAQTGLNGDFNTTAFDSVDTEVSTTATRLSQGGSLNGGGKDLLVLGNALYDTSNSGSPGFNLAGTTLATQSAAATAGDWFSFTLEANGATVNYESLSLYSDQYGAGGKLDISYTIGTVETFVLQDYIMPEGHVGNVPVELKAVDFADFSSTNDVVWTFYLHGAPADNYGNRFDDITLYGSSDAIVEESEAPSTGFYRINLQ